MKKEIRPLLTLFGLLVMITGVFYPVLVTGLSQAFFPFQANGSLVQQNGKVVGSELIGQDFTNEKYFWGRPSATSGRPYNAFDSENLTGSSGSNLGPLSQNLIDSIQLRVDKLINADPGNSLFIPIDLVTASGSGLDPHISVDAAYYQISRVAQTRGMTEADVASLVDQFTENRQFGFLGEPRVNVFLLNLALDRIK
jgi:potassium-transporting ATPase KdpC subunit